MLVFFVFKNKEYIFAPDDDIIICLKSSNY